MRQVLLLSLVLASLAPLALAEPAPASAEPAASPYKVIEADARIPFANTLVDGFRVGLDGSLILNGPANRWYRATLDPSCQRDLKWEEAIAIRSTFSGALDRFDSVTIDGRRCQLRSLDRIEDPRPVERAARAAARAAAQAAKQDAKP